MLFLVFFLRTFKINPNKAFAAAMKKKLYDSVDVHGPQGAAESASGESIHVKAKAYACTNCMEFFAELSVAFLWAADERTEYNKWFPFNRHQLLLHDAETHDVLQKCWMQYEQEKERQKEEGEDEGEGAARASKGVGPLEETSGNAPLTPSRSLRRGGNDDDNDDDLVFGTPGSGRFVPDYNS
jgi:hypothetical protein